jgi:hypothetical protein
MIIASPSGNCSQPQGACNPLSKKADALRFSGGKHKTDKSGFLNGVDNRAATQPRTSGKLDYRA